MIQSESKMNLFKNGSHTHDSVVQNLPDIRNSMEISPKSKGISKNSEKIAVNNQKFAQVAH